MQTKTKTGSDRLQYLDWLRGMGAAIMLHGHVWDSFLKDKLRSGTPFLLSQFLGGMPPAIFLFLTGVTLGFLMDSAERKGLTPRDSSLLKAVFLDERDRDEVCQEFGVDRDYLRVLLHRAKREFKAEYVKRMGNRLPLGANA